MHLSQSAPWVTYFMRYYELSRVIWSGEERYQWPCIRQKSQKALWLLKGLYIESNPLKALVIGKYGTE